MKRLRGINVVIFPKLMVVSLYAGMKKVWYTLTSSIRNPRFRRLAIKHIENGDNNEISVKLHSADKKRVDEALADESASKEIHHKHEYLIGNMKQFSIKSVDVTVDRSRSETSREVDYSSVNRLKWKYGFFEPPPNEIPIGKLTFRQAIDMLSIRGNKEHHSESNQSGDYLENLLEKHPSIDGVQKESLDRIWQYFRVFGYKEAQKVVRNSDVRAIQEAFHGFNPVPRSFKSVVGEMREALKGKISSVLNRDTQLETDGDGPDDYETEVKKRRKIEEQRLNRQMQIIDLEQEKKEDSK